MYQDTKRIRVRYASVNLDDQEAKLVDAAIAICGDAKATVLRHMIMREALALLDTKPATTPSVRHHG